MIDREQAAFFARNGFLQLRGVIPGDVCAHLVECTWGHLPETWERDDPATWSGPVGDSCHVASLATRRGLMKFASGCAGRASEARQQLYGDPMVTQSYQDPSVGHAAAAALIGRPLHPIRLRGLFAIAPVREGDGGAASSPHVEAHPAQIVAMTYLDEVAPGGGGVTVWPGSHRALHSAFLSKFEYVAAPDLKDRIDALLRWQPIELSGRRGDLLLMHHRLLHSPSLNRSSRIRFAFLCDYTPRDHQLLAKEPPGELWAEWPGLVALCGPEGLAGEPDFPRVPAPSVRRPLWKCLLAALRSEVQQRTANKGEASRIGRLRRPGEVWLALADVAELHESIERLDPRGNPLRARWPWSRGVRVRCNGVAVPSLTHGGFTGRLPVREGANELRVSGVDRRLWLRVVALQLPFSSSRVLVRREFDGTQSELVVTFDWQAGPAVDASTPPAVEATG